MKRIAILGSGIGNNYRAIVNYFSLKQSKPDITLISNNLKADMLEFAKDANLKHFYLPDEEFGEFFSTQEFDLIVLDYLSCELPASVLELGRFINIHPSLLPAFKGKDAIARAFNAGVKVSGVTVHTLTDDIEGGKILAQFPVLIGSLTHFDEFETEIHKLEQRLYPIVIEKILEDKVFDFSDLISEGSCGNCGGCG